MYVGNEAPKGYVNDVRDIADVRHYFQKEKLKASSKNKGLFSHIVGYTTSLGIKVTLNN